MYTRGGERFLVGERNVYTWREWAHNCGVWVIYLWCYHEHHAR